MLQVEGHKETAHNPKQARHLPIINPNKHNFPIKSYEQYSSNEITNFHSLEHSASSVFHQGSKLCRNQSEASLVSNAPSTFMPSKYYEYEAQFQQSNESAESKGRKGTRVNFSIRKSAADCSKSNNFKPKEPMPSVLKAVSLKRSNSDMVKTRVERPSLQFSNFETVRHNPHPGKTEVYTSEESSKPAFILGSSAQVTKASKNSCQDWKTLNELPSVYTLSEQTSKVSFTKSIMSNKTEQELRSN